MSTTEMTDLRRTIGHLRQCVGSLRSVYGDASAVRRLANDVDRLDIDASDMEHAMPRAGSAGGAHRQRAAEHVYIEDTPYERSLWEGADDEGVGGLRHEGP